MSLPALWSQIDAALMSEIVNAPSNAQLKPAIQKLIRLETRKYPNPIQQLQARKTFLIKRYKKDPEARKNELSQLLYGYLSSTHSELVEQFAEHAKEERGEEGEIFFTVDEMKAAIAALREKCEERFLFLHTYAFALLQEKPEFLEILREEGAQLSEWVNEVLEAA